ERTSLQRRCASRLEAVANPGICQDVSRLVVRLELVAQLIDEDAEILRLMDALSAPHGVQERAVSEHLVGMARHVDQQIKFFGREVTFFVPSAHRTCFRIDIEVSRLDWL